MTEAELETYLHDNIPLTRAMAVRVVSIAPDKVVLGAPLAPNINVHDTVFGGSASTLATITAWSLIYTRLLAAGRTCDLVIQRSTMEFIKPIRGDFTAVAVMSDGSEWADFLRTLDRKGRARITVEATLDFADALAGLFRGDFVALRS